MAHEFLIKDIAFQAGLSTATVDRVINGRDGVRKQTRARVEAAIGELKKQENALAIMGRTFVFDVIMETPDRFSSAVREAFEAVSPQFLPSVLRSRFHFAEKIPEREMIRLLKRIANRGTDGIVIKAAASAAIMETIAMLKSREIPVITIATDIPGSERIAYAGADNRSAGETAAYLIGNMVDSGHVLVTLSSTSFHGEEEREAGFRALLARLRPDLKVTTTSGGYGRDLATGAQVREALSHNPDINCVYSIGGGNRSIVDSFDGIKRKIDCYVAHDLDQDNIRLLREQRINFVLHHDLRGDAALVFRTFLNRLSGHQSRHQQTLSALAIITRFNLLPL